jgi:hypothetical protein
MPYIDRGLVLCTRQKLTFNKFRTGLTLGPTISAHIKSLHKFLFLVLFTRQKASSGEHGELATTPETRHITRDNYIFVI